MKRNRSLSSQAQDLLAILGSAPNDWCYGYELMKATGIKSGTLYPVLMRYEPLGFETRHCALATQSAGLGGGDAR